MTTAKVKSRMSADMHCVQNDSHKDTVKKIMKNLSMKLILTNNCKRKTINERVCSEIKNLKTQHE